MNPALCHAGSRIHKISSTLSKVIGDGGRGDGRGEEGGERGGGRGEGRREGRGERGGGRGEGRGRGEKALHLPFYPVKFCVMINFSRLCHNVLCFSFVVVLCSMYSLYAIIKVVLLNERDCHV